MVRMGAENISEAEDMVRREVVEGREGNTSVLIHYLAISSSMAGLSLGRERFPVVDLPYGLVEGLGCLRSVSIEHSKLSVDSGLSLSEMRCKI